MPFALSGAASAAGHRLVAFDTIGSTSEEALLRARGGEGGPLWLVSPEQTAGRGRRGNAWQSVRGNLHASLLVTTDLSPPVIAQLGFVAGVALWRAFDLLRQGEAPDGVPTGSTFTLKWPNDLLADGAKVAGILLQTEQIGTRRAVVVGMGVNVVACPALLPYPATSLRQLGFRSGAAALFEVLSGTMIEALDLWRDGSRFDAVRRIWLEHAAGIGRRVAIRQADGVALGVFETIDEHGQLVLRQEDGSSRPISAGEVHFGSAASVRPEVHA